MSLNIQSRLLCGGQSGLKSLLVIIPAALACGAIALAIKFTPPIVMQGLFWLAVVCVGGCLLIMLASILVGIYRFIKYAVTGKMVKDISRTYQSVVAEFREPKAPAQPKPPFHLRAYAWLSGTLASLTASAKDAYHTEGALITFSAILLQLLSWGFCTYLYGIWFLNEKGEPVGSFVACCMLASANVFVGRGVLIIWEDIDYRYLPTRKQRIAGIITTLNIPMWAGLLGLYQSWPALWVLASIATGLVFMAVVLGLVYQCSTSTDESEA